MASDPPGARATLRRGLEMRLSPRCADADPCVGSKPAWSLWEQRLATAPSPAKLLTELTDEDIIELLTGAPADRRRDRNMLATEALNRMARARTVIIDAARDLSDELSHIQGVVAEGIQQARSHDEAEAASADQLDVRNEAREEVLDHIRTGGSFSGLARISAHLVKVGEDTLAHTRHPEMYSD